MREDEPFSNPIAPAGHQAQQDEKDESKPLSNDDFRLVQTHVEIIEYKYILTLYCICRTLRIISNKAAAESSG